LVTGRLCTNGFSGCSSAADGCRSTLPILLLTVIFLAIAATVTHAAGISGGWEFLMLSLFALPALEGAVGLFNTLMLLFMRPTRLVGLRIQGRCSCRGAHAGRCADPDRLARRRGGNGSPDGGALPRQHAWRALLRAAVRLAGRQRPSRMSATSTFWPMRAPKSLNSTIAIRRAPPHDSTCCTAAASITSAEGVWMGWERKRGKLARTRPAAARRPDTTFVPLDAPLPPDVVHVLTLDADTRMTRDAATHLAGKLAHPMNRPKAE
jgi:cyclic beta-1,2-glucan synthetase